MHNLYEVHPNGIADQVPEAERVVAEYLRRYPSLRIFEGAPDPTATGVYEEVNDEIFIRSESDPEFGGSREQWYRVLFHELTHSTGHDSRLDRLRQDRKNPFKQGVEELIAELGSTLLTEELGMASTRPMHDMYLRHYVADIGATPRVVGYAAQRAKEAAELILGRESHAAREMLATAA